MTGEVHVFTRSKTGRCAGGWYKRVPDDPKNTQQKKWVTALGRVLVFWFESFFFFSVLGECLVVFAL